MSARRRRKEWSFTWRAALALVPLFSASASAQLRPLNQTQWNLFDTRADVAATLGFSRLFDQRASLAGSSGHLWELGSFSLAWKTGRVVLEAAGTAQRIFKERSRFAAPYPDVRTTVDGGRHDSGDYRISTAVRLTPERWPVRGGLRFGTRLPTTDNETGLDRDAIDFFALLGGSSGIGFIVLTGEAGLGIHTTRETRFEQDDLFLYSLRAETRGRISPSVEVVGQKHGQGHREIRGVEDLGEVRLGLRAGQKRWIRVEGVKGFETFSPSAGVIVTAGIVR
jgi:hypothetical protein